jgi:hypothetical protein
LRVGFKTQDSAMVKIENALQEKYVLKFELLAFENQV